MQDDIIPPKQPPTQDPAAPQTEGGQAGQPLNNPGIPQENIENTPPLDKDTEAAKIRQIPNGTQPKKVKKGHGLVIVFAVIVFVALSALAVYAGLQQDKSERANQSSPLIDL